MNAKVLWGIIAIIVILGGIYWLATSNTPETVNQNALENGTENSDQVSTQGRVVFSITDAAANMSNFSEVNMTVSRVEFYNQSRGWVTASSTPRTYNLLALDAEN